MLCRLGACPHLLKAPLRFPFRHTSTVPQAALALAQLIDDIRCHGHRIARLDPLGRAAMGPWVAPPTIPLALTAQPLANLVCRLRALTLPQEREWLLQQHICSESAHNQPEAQQNLHELLSMLTKPLRLKALTADRSLANSHTPLAQLVQALLDRYCDTLAVESGHLSCEAQRHWVQAAVESRAYASTPAQQRHVLKALVHADTLERFLAHRFPKSKRFGIEGCEAAIPGLLALCAAFAQGGGRRVELAMAHRHAWLCTCVHIGC